MGEKILRYLFDGPGKDRWTNMTLNILRTKETEVDRIIDGAWSGSAWTMIE
ncbi:MAG: hypothetical protein ACOX4J_06330 [Anaerovoracaceae bacterium]|jgi:hypothetical protein